MNKTKRLNQLRPFDMLYVEAKLSKSRNLYKSNKGTSRNKIRDKVEIDVNLGTVLYFNATSLENKMDELACSTFMPLG